MLKQSLLSPIDKKKLNLAASHELYASNLYKHLSNCMQNMGLFGCQKYFLGESSDELTHYQKVADFMNDRFDQVIVDEVPKIDDKIETVKDAFETALQAELDLEKFYTEFYSDSEDETVKQFLLQFIEIQRTSVGEYGDFLATIEFLGNDKAGLLLFDKEIND